MYKKCKAYYTGITLNIYIYDIPKTLEYLQIENLLSNFK